jgi:hypothetical protein
MTKIFSIAISSYSNPRLARLAAELYVENATNAMQKCKRCSLSIYPALMISFSKPYIDGKC